MNNDTTDPNDVANDQVADLLKHASRRAPAPQATRQRAYDRLHRHWSQQTARRQALRRNILWAVAASCVLAVGLVGTVLNDIGRTPVEPVAELLRTSGGGVRLMDADGNALATGNGGILSGQLLYTDAGARAALRWLRGGSLRVDSSTRIELLSPERIRLIAGAVYFDSASQTPAPGGGSHFSIETPYGEVTHVGTQFLTRIGDETLTLSVREGEVAVTADGARLLLPAGDEVDLGVDGITAERQISAHGDRWQWVQDIAPAFDSEGRSVQALLDWIVRETGYRLHYRNAAAANFARRVELHGIEQLGPMQALQSLPFIADLQYELSNGVIEISLLDTST